MGENESVKWKIKDKTLTVDFMSVNKEVIGKVNAAMTAGELIAKYNPDRIINLETRLNLKIMSFHTIMLKP